MKNIAYYPTPTEIVKTIISLTNTENKKILETGFGQGAFLNELLKLKIENLYGIELDIKFYNDFKNNNTNKNIILINDDYLNHTFEEKFDIIIGNPPYITGDNLPIKIKDKIKKLTGSGEGNIYYAFILKSIKNLKENGELIYILPYDFFFNTFAKTLRNTLIEEGYFEIIIDLQDIKIFKGAAPETIIFKWIKSKNKKKKINIYKNIKKENLDVVVNNLNLILKSNKSNEFFDFFKIENFKKEEIWSLSKFNEYNNSSKLNQLAKTGVGIVNGCENIFNVDLNFIKTLNEIEQTFIKTFIKAKNINDFKINNLENNNYIFLNEKIINTEEKLKTLPNLYNYFKKFESTLKNRYLSGKKEWFHYLAIRNMKLIEENFNKYKIIIPNITRKKNKWCSLTKNNDYISGDVLMIISENEKTTFYLFGILNSDYFINYYKEKGAKKGARIIFTQKILDNINIPIFSDIIKNEIINEVEKMIILNTFDFDNINKIIEKEIS